MLAWWAEQPHGFGSPSDRMTEQEARSSKIVASPRYYNHLVLFPCRLDRMALYMLGGHMDTIKRRPSLSACVPAKTH